MGKPAQGHSGRKKLSWDLNPPDTNPGFLVTSQHALLLFTGERRRGGPVQQHRVVFSRRTLNVSHVSGLAVTTRTGKRGAEWKSNWLKVTQPADGRASKRTDTSTGLGGATFGSGGRRLLYETPPARPGATPPPRTRSGPGWAEGRALRGRRRRRARGRRRGACAL